MGPGKFLIAAWACLGITIGGPVLYKSHAAETLHYNNCLQCHSEFKGRDDLIAGTFVKRSRLANTMEVEVGKTRHFLQYSDKTQMKLGMPLGPKVPVAVTFKNEDGKMVATKVASMPPVTVPKAQMIKADELSRLVGLGPEKGKYTLVDSRPGLRYEEGHIPTAVSVPLESMESMRSKFPKDKKNLLIFYCGGTHCTLSPTAALMAKKWGYENIRVYTLGAPDWAKTGHLLLTTDAYLSERLGYLVLLDIRGPKTAAQGHIPGAVAVKPARLGAMRDRFPADLKAPIVLYGQDTDDSVMEPLVTTIRGWGYKRVFVLKGGFTRWSVEKGLVRKGGASPQIVYIPKPAIGSIGRSEFAKIIEDEPEGKIIVDVRGPKEYAAGHISGALNIPVDELKVRINEVPKDKEAILHCATGMRAEMGYNILKKAGRRARFLNDEITIVGKNVYLGTTVEIPWRPEDDEKEKAPPKTGEAKVQVSTPDTALAARLIRFGKVSFQRKRFSEAKQYFWKAILADPTARAAWRYYDLSLIYSLAERVEQDPGCIGMPGAPSGSPARGLRKKADEGC